MFLNPDKFISERTVNAGAVFAHARSASAPCQPRAETQGCCREAVSE
jgi:hypothetical protein